jgi:hypothetical protein
MGLVETFRLVTTRPGADRQNPASDAHWRSRGFEDKAWRILPHPPVVTGGMSRRDPQASKRNPPPSRNGELRKTQETLGSSKSLERAGSFGRGTRTFRIFVAFLAIRDVARRFRSSHQAVTDLARRLRAAGSMKVLVTGVTGYVGSRLVPRLQRDGHELVGFVRSPQPPDLGISIVRGDAVSGRGLEEALDGVDVAYYLIHSMEPDGGNRAFDLRERAAANNFARAAVRAGVKRVI